MFDALYRTLIFEDRWKFYAEGLFNTLLMTTIACILGIIIGVIIALIKVKHAQNGKLKILNGVCDLYTTVIRGTPVLVQVLILWYIVFPSAPANFAVFGAALAFGMNSGAYVSETIRAGIQSVNRGQMEAGCSLGLSQGQTMRLIIIPQAIKNILPALFNEFIQLVKETSVAGWIAVVDITRAGDLIRTRVWTYTPLLVSAAMYLIIVLALTRVQKSIEKRLNASDTH
ncbi:MAG: amino acid ABC transporter permease [Deferribacteraceae bacterium]|jgi:His/Glu/Gln/Arg/opine family amino acid ABC transporter permease subunit|nr:amino acid ABC transporter permease [Deferribacteraceae bacterium]